MHIIYLRAVVYYTIRELFAGLCPEECVIYRGRTAVSERKEGPQHDERPQIKRNALISIRMFPLVSHPPPLCLVSFFFSSLFLLFFLLLFLVCVPCEKKGKEKTKTGIASGTYRHYTQAHIGSFLSAVSCVTAYIYNSSYISPYFGWTVVTLMNSNL